MIMHVPRHAVMPILLTHCWGRRPKGASKAGEGTKGAAEMRMRPLGGMEEGGHPYKHRHYRYGGYATWVRL